MSASVYYVLFEDERKELNLLCKMLDGFTSPNRATGRAEVEEKRVNEVSSVRSLELRTLRL